MIDNWTLGSIVYFAVVIIVSLKVSTIKCEDHGNYVHTPELKREYIVFGADPVDICTS